MFFFFISQHPDISLTHCPSLEINFVVNVSLHLPLNSFKPQGV